MSFRQLIYLLTLFLTPRIGFSQTQPSQGLQTVSLNPGSSVTLNANVNSLNVQGYQWYRDGSLIAGAIRDKYIASTAGLYTVQTFNSSNCASEISAGVLIIVNTFVPSFADVAIKKASESRNVTINEPFAYTIQVHNKGTDKATSLTISDVLPAGLELVEIIPPPTGTAIYNASVRTVIWTIPELLTGQDAHIKINARAIKSGTIDNTATVAAFENDPDLSNNTSTDSKEISGLRVPNVFSPNGDGLNDRYKIPGLELFAENEFTVINRWGSQVFEKSAYTDEWTGEGLNEGTYFYLLKVKTPDGIWQVYKGYITLLRARE